MNLRKRFSTFIAAILLALLAATPALAQQKPNILFIMGDDIGWMQPSIYHRGLMVGETPNIDRIGREGAKFMTYYAEQSCTAGRNAFFTGMHPLRPRMSSSHQLFSRSHPTTEFQRSSTQDTNIALMESGAILIYLADKSTPASCCPSLVKRAIASSSG